MTNRAIEIKKYFNLEGGNLAKKDARVRIKTGLANSDPCKVMNPKSTHRVEPLTSTPITKVAIKLAIKITYRTPDR